MLIKLLKYDFRSMLRLFLPLWGAFLAVSLINRFTVSRQFMDLYEYNISVSETISGLFMLLYIMLMMAINIIGIVIVIQRFYQGLLKDEGYLMFTLPAKPWQLITAKGLSATVLVLINGFISMVSVFILAADASFFDDMSRFFTWLSENNIQTGFFIFLLILLIIVTIMSSCTMVYAAMAIGHLANKHRVGFAVLAYLGLSMVMSMLTTVIGSILDYNDWLSDWVYNAILGLSDMTVLNMFIGITIFIAALGGAIYFVITERILSTKLNLE